MESLAILARLSPVLIAGRFERIEETWQDHGLLARLSRLYPLQEEK
jgi:hypothetical protein